MAEIWLRINGRELVVPPGTLLAAALEQAGIPTRRSERGDPRAPLCGMGICYECRVTINGISHQLSCQRFCEPGMEVETG